MKQFGEFRLDVENECLWRGPEQVPLRPRPFAVLRYLVEHSGRLVTHDELLDALWPNTYVQPQILRTYTQDLRRLLGDEAGQPRFIQTLPKRGYCFVAAVTDWAAPQAGNSNRDRVAPEAAGGVQSEVCFGRGDELRRLERVWRELGQGQRRTVFVAGEIGSGKTALADAFVASVGGGDEVLVARGQCVEGFGATHEYYPLMEAIAHLCALPGGEKVCEIFRKVAPDWLSTPGRGSRNETSRSDKSRGETWVEGVLEQRSPGELCEALEKVAQGTPLILLLEDLHWADASTLHLVSALARRRAPVRLLVMATCRPHYNGGTRLETSGDIHFDRQLKSLTQDLILHRLAEEILLEPLGKSATREMCERELGGGVISQALASFIHQRSGGNPLFVRSMVEHLAAQSMVVQEMGKGAMQWVAAADSPEMEKLVPVALGQMIELEIERLAPAERCLLEAGSLMSVAFPAWAVSAALERDALECEEDCDRVAGRVPFLERLGEEELPDGTQSAFYGFTHELYRDVLLNKQSHGRRARRHTRIAERLAELFRGREADVAEELAYHYEAGEQWERAGAALELAASHARMRMAGEQALALERKAERLMEKARGSRLGANAPALAAAIEGESDGVVGTADGSFLQ